LDSSWNPLSGSAFGWLHTHQGLRFEALAGLFDNRARWYSPTLMRFVSNDPIGFGGGSTNLYIAYGNGPGNATDSSGFRFLYNWRVPSGPFQGTLIPLQGFLAEAAFWYDLMMASPANEAILGRLWGNPDFQKLWYYLSTFPFDTTLVIISNPKLPFGITDVGGQTLTINVGKPQTVANPLLTAETIVHESVHLYLRYKRVEEQIRAMERQLKIPKPLIQWIYNFQLPAGVLDYHCDPELARLEAAAGVQYQGLRLTDIKPTTPEQVRLLEYMRRIYAPAVEFGYLSDINIGANRWIVGVLQDVLNDPWVWFVTGARPTTTFGFVGVQVQPPRAPGWLRFIPGGPTIWSAFVK
jgi:RHS repeat-associated protein